MERFHDRHQVGVLLRTPDEDVYPRSRLGHAADLCQRRERIGDELETVERRDDVERAIRVGERLDVADVEASFGDALARVSAEIKRVVRTTTETDLKGVLSNPPDSIRGVIAGDR